MRGHQARLRAMLLLAGVLGASACASWPWQGEPPPPGFNEITDEQLRSAMWRLAEGVRDIRVILASESPNRPVQQPEIVRILDEMIVAADELGPEDGVATEHWSIPHSLGRFREKLAVARDAAARNPPRYFLVGNLSGTCLTCHRSE